MKEQQIVLNFHFKKSFFFFVRSFVYPSHKNARMCERVTDGKVKICVEFVRDDAYEVKLTSKLQSLVVVVVLKMLTPTREVEV